MLKPFTLKKKSTLVFFVTTLLVITTLPVNSQLLDPTSQAKFVNPLPIPFQINAATGVPFEMEMNEVSQWLGLTDPLTGAPLLTKVWGYGPLGGMVTFPGPTFIAKRGVPTTITWHNNLPAGHFLPVDPTLHLAHPMGVDAAAFYSAGNIPTVVHLHGGKTESASDGLPEAWYTQGFGTVGPHFVKQSYRFDNNQEAATLWYHDHALGITRLNVYAGLAGFYLIEDKIERNLVKNNVLPKGKQDIEIVIQDRMFDANGQLFIPSKSGDAWFGDAWGSIPSPPDSEPLELPFYPNPSVVAEFFGDFIVVNGVTWPHLKVEPRPYRFRFLNGSDSRFYVLEFDAGMPFLQIATDDGLLPNAVSLAQLIIAPGERAEVVVDFSGMKDQNITLVNYGPDAPYKGADENQAAADPMTTGQVMQFQVTKKLKVNKGVPIPTVISETLLRAPLEDLGPASKVRHLALFEGMDADGRLQPLLGVINGDLEKSAGPLNGSLAWFEDITENPAVGAVEEWWVYNATEDAHPIHLHLVSFQIINREAFSSTVNDQDQIQHDGNFGTGGYIPEGSIVHSGVVEEPPANEKGWKDTFIVPPGYVGRIKARFDLPGRYVWHCHILSHEDHEMMRPFHVGPMPSTALKGANVNNSSFDTQALENNPLHQTDLDFTEFNLYPNPVADKVFVDFTLDQHSDIILKLYGMDGRLIMSKELGSMQKGHHSQNLSLDNLDNGLYVLELNAGVKLYREKFFISR